jgi:hypothetical protein
MCMVCFGFVDYRIGTFLKHVHLSNDCFGF